MMASLPVFYSTANLHILIVIIAAAVVFQELKSGNSIYKNKAIWNLALSKLKQKDYKSCKEILLTIPADYENYDQVQELLQELD